MWTRSGPMIAPTGATTGTSSSPVSATKDDASMILSATPPARPKATPPIGVVSESGPPSKTQVSLATGGGPLKVDKNTLSSAFGRADAFNSAFGDVPDDAKLWETPGLMRVA